MNDGKYGRIVFGKYIAAYRFRSVALRGVGDMEHLKQHLEPQTYTVEEAAIVLGISRWLAYELVQRGELPIIRIGKRRVLVPKARIDAMLRGEAVTAGQAQPVAAGR